MGRRLDDSRIVTRDIPLSLIDKHQDNYNKHPRTQIEELAASHNEFGQYRTIVVWQRPNGRFTLVAGEGFSTGAAEDGAKVMRCDILPEDTDPLTIKAIMAADNIHNRNSEPDNAKLYEILQEQAESGYDLMALGTSSDALEALLEHSEKASRADQNDKTEQDEQKGTGKLLSLLEVTIADPKTKVTYGDIWKLDKHVLICAHVMRDWQIWRQYLEGAECYFVPYAGPLVPLSKRADEKKLVMVQPDTYIAGHVIDRFIDIHGKRTIRKVGNVGIAEEVIEEEPMEEELER